MTTSASTPWTRGKVPRWRLDPGEALADLEVRWLYSYEELEREERRFINSGENGSANEARERLVMNFDAEEVAVQAG